MNNPFFSIIIPFYNVPGGYFKKCIQSIITQTFENFEIVIVDDGSKPEGVELCDRIASMDSRIRVFHQKNQGVSAARNFGIGVAKADWIMFVDGDDWLESDACEVLHNYLLKTSCDVLLFGAIKEFAGKTELLNYGLEPCRIYDMSDIDVREMMYRRAMGATNEKSGRLSTIYYSCDKVFRRKFLVDNELKYPVGLPKSEDKVFILSVFEKMKSLFFYGNHFYHYRINEESVCNKLSMTADKDRMLLVSYLEPIAMRMDKELGFLKKDAGYARIKKDYMRFVFGIITDVLLLKYFHKDYQAGLFKRCRETRKFIHSEPFKSAIKECKYSELVWNAKLKKFMLSCNFVFLFYCMKRVRSKIAGKAASRQ